MESWKKGFRKAVISTIVEKGTPVDTNRNNRSLFYGWMSYDWGRITGHLHECGIDVDKCGDPDDTEWFEFMGTFYEGDHIQRGIEVTITCSCGEITEQPYRMTSGFAELLRDILRKAE